MLIVGVNYSCEDWIAVCPVLIALEDDDTGEKIKRIRRKMQLMESGLYVDYRCIIFRECVHCKKSDHAEKISVRCERAYYLIGIKIRLRALCQSGERRETS